MKSSFIVLARKSQEPYWFRMTRYLIVSMMLMLAAFWVGRSLVSDVAAQGIEIDTSGSLAPYAQDQNFFANPSQGNALQAPVDLSQYPTQNTAPAVPVNTSFPDQPGYVPTAIDTSGSLAPYAQDQNFFANPSQGNALQAPVDLSQYPTQTQTSNTVPIVPATTAPQPANIVAPGRGSGSLNQSGGGSDLVNPVIFGSGPRGGSKVAADYITRQNTGITVNTDLKLTIASWVRLLLTLIAVIAVVAVVAAGAYYILSFGDDSRKETAKRILIYVTAGAFLILGSYAIVNTIINAQF